MRTTCWRERGRCSDGVVEETLLGRTASNRESKIFTPGHEIQPPSEPFSTNTKYILASHKYSSPVPRNHLEQAACTPSSSICTMSMTLLTTKATSTRFSTPMLNASSKSLMSTHAFARNFPNSFNRGLRVCILFLFRLRVFMVNPVNYYR